MAVRASTQRKEGKENTGRKGREGDMVVERGKGCKGCVRNSGFGPRLRVR